MTPKSSRTRFVYFLVFAIVFAAVAPFILLYSFGYNWSQNFSLLQTGGIYVYSGETGAQLYVDDKLNDSTSVFQRGILVKDLRPDQYSIKLAKEGYLDWNKNIEVKAKKVAEAYPFLIPSQIVATSVPTLISKSNANASSSMIANPEYKDLLSLFSTSTKDTLAKKVATTASTTKPVSVFPNIESKKLVIEKIGNDLRATWDGSINDTPFYFCIQNKEACVKNFTVYSKPNIGTFNFYPSRNDVIIVVVKDAIEVIELDQRPPQNIVEIYRTESKNILDFRVLDNETIVVKDGKKIMKLSLVYAKQ